jgi:polysaccharide pyruvyl transferase WcaK-like protein
MKVGLINTYSTHNVGDSAIYSALSGLLQDHQVIASFKEDNPRTLGNIEIVPEVQDCDAYVSVGGDIFNNARPKLITRQFLTNLQQLDKNNRATFLFGQSIPDSCQGLSFKLLCNRLKRLSAVTVRDHYSHDRLVEGGVIDAHLSYDAAFTLQCSQPSIKHAQAKLEKLEIDADKSCMISLRGFNAMYPHDEDEFINQISILCQRLIKDNLQPVLLIQSQVSSHDSDLLVAEKIIKRVKGTKVINIFEHIELFQDWEMLQAFLSLSHSIVAVRYHTAVLALATGRVPFNLFYSNKGRDLSDRFNMPGCSVSDFRCDKFYDQIRSIEKRTINIESVRNQVREDFNYDLSTLNPRSFIEVDLQCN